MYTPILRNIILLCKSIPQLYLKSFCSTYILFVLGLNNRCYITFIYFLCTINYTVTPSKNFASVPQRYLSLLKNKILLYSTKIVGWYWLVNSNLVLHSIQFFSIIYLHHYFHWPTRIIIIVTSWTLSNMNWFHASTRPTQRGILLNNNNSYSLVLAFAFNMFLRSALVFCVD